MQTIFTTMHHIDLEKEEIIFKELDKNDVQNYITTLTDEILINPHTKGFVIESETTEVVSVVKNTFLLDQLSDSFRDTVAKRLLKSEVKTQEKIKQLKKEIKKGSLIQSYFIKDEFSYFLIAKIESNRFLDVGDLVSKEGLPHDKKAFKTCVFKMRKPDEIISILISDNNRRISDYWQSDFLEVKELSSDEQNTEKAFTVITNQLRKDLEKKYPSDYVLCRNIVLGYFKTGKVFRKKELIEDIIGGYTPENSEIDMLKVTGNVARAYKNKIADTEFDIKPKAIKAKKWKETKQVNNFIDLTLTGVDSQIRNNIQSVEENGEQFIKIRSTNPSTFDSFKWT
ncbi:hypothetical protein [uncultured Vagococcus sp.]|uniref:hypothetical protein n=1 Tax=uncultured Vagococcus sp. TaxID=189676 RepID=UPI0028D45A30|nr:hypothetical protein [uncultured Vagococcus sp.]